MSDFQKFISGKDSSSPEPVHYVPPVEKDKKGKEEEYSQAERTVREKSMLFASLYVYLKKLLHFLSPRQKAASVATAQEHISEDLVGLRKILLILSNDDESHDPEFLQQLSELWHTLLDDFNHLLSLEGKMSPFSSQVKNLLDQIETYPPSEDHSLGFYLREYVGREWLPFPFMELLQALHQEHQKIPAASYLSQWIDSLNNILSSLDHSSENNQGLKH